MLLRFFVLNILLLLLSLGVTAQESTTKNRYGAGKNDGFVQHVNFGLNPAEISKPRVCEKLETVLSISMKGDDIFSFAWMKVDSARIYSDSSKLIFSEATLSDSGFYYCRVDNGIDTLFSDTLKLEVIRPTVKLAFVGGNSLCIGEKSQIEISVTVPKDATISAGPWEMLFVNSKGEDINESMGLAEPFILKSKSDGTVLDTLPPFTLTSSDTIFSKSITEVLSIEGNCPIAIDSTGEVPFTILPMDDLKFDFASGKDIIGICESIGLDTLLKPTIDDGQFYVNNDAEPVVDFIAASAKIGKNVVKYRTNGTCPSSDSVDLWVNDYPKLIVTPADTSLCFDQRSELTVSAIGSGPFNLKYDIKNVGYDATSSWEQPFEKDDLPFTTTVVYSSIKDKSRSINPSELIDKFGCIAPAPYLDSANVDFLERLEFELLGQYLPEDGNDWNEISAPYIIDSGDSVDYKIKITTGLKPWYYEIISPGAEPQMVGPIYGNDTIYRAKKEGTYQFSVSDASECASSSIKESSIIFKKKGYLAIKTMLEGPLVERAGTQHVMRADLQRLNILQGQLLGVKWNEVTETDSIVDLIVVELREDRNKQAVARDTFLLRNDGQLLTREGNETLEFNISQSVVTDLYVVVSHRNHLSVISTDKMIIKNEEDQTTANTCDFTQTGVAYSPSGTDAERLLHMSKVGDLWIMAVGGEVIVEDELVSISNANLVKFAKKEEQTVRGYYTKDVNMNGIVEYPDRTDLGFIYEEGNEAKFKTMDYYMVHRNRSKYSIVPFVPYSMNLTLNTN